MYPNAITEFVFDQSLAHGAFTKDALNAKDMNVRPGGKQHLMHNTSILVDNSNLELHGKWQMMVFLSDLPPHHPDFALHGQGKGMHHVLEEHGLISVLQVANGRKAVGECQTCKMSHEAQDQMHHEAQVAAEGGEKPGESNIFDIVQKSLRIDCCRQKMLTNQQDFNKEEKPLIWLVIEAAGHKCWFLPKFHCELNPIEIYWRWMKACEC